MLLEILSMGLNLIVLVNLQWEEWNVCVYRKGYQIIGDRIIIGKFRRDVVKYQIYLQFFFGFLFCQNGGISYLVCDVLLW